MKKTLTIFACVIAALASPVAGAQSPAAGETDMQALRNAVRADKKALITSTLQLTPEQAKKFWPIYDAYQRDLDLANQRRNLVVIEVVGPGKPISDLYARKLVDELLAADDAELKSRKSMQSKVMKALPPRKAARYLQLENKIRAMQAYDIAATLPLID
jgi:Spy/CpxP family protein refolding chaperone